MLTVPPDFPYNPWAKVGLGGWHYSNCLFLRVTKHKIINIWNFGTHKENQTAPSLQEKRSLRPLTRDTNRWDNKWIARSRTNTNWWAWLKIDDLVERKLALWTGSNHHHNLDLSLMGLWGCVQSKAQTWRKKALVDGYIMSEHDQSSILRWLNVIFDLPHRLRPCSTTVEKRSMGDQYYAMRLAKLVIDFTWEWAWYPVIGKRESQPKGCDKAYWRTRLLKLTKCAKLLMNSKFVGETDTRWNRTLGHSGLHVTESKERSKVISWGRTILFVMPVTQDRVFFFVL